MLLLSKPKKTKWIQLKIHSTMTITLEKCASLRCPVSLTKILSNPQNNKSQKWQWTFQRKKLSSFIIWMRDKSSLLEKNIQEIRLWAWVKLTQIKKRAMIQSLNNNIKSCYKWKNKLINLSVKLKPQLLKNTKV